jgi:hypothetical protein
VCSLRDETSISATRAQGDIVSPNWPIVIRSLALEFHAVDIVIHLGLNNLLLHAAFHEKVSPSQASFPPLCWPLYPIEVAAELAAVEP